MRASSLAKIAYEVWGARWPVELARILERHPVTVRRWAAGLTHMSRKDHHRAKAAMRAYSRQRHKNVREMLSRLKNPEDSSWKPKRLRPWTKTPLDPIPPWKKSAQHADNQLQLPDF